MPVVKFRAMVRDAETVYNREVVPVQDGVRFLNVPPESKLYTPIGRLIERLGLTELPQLFLVLAGRMSLVGNRPLPGNVMASLRESNDDVDARVDTPAGLTGPVQLIGRERLSDAERLDLERTYCRVALQSNTWKLDFLILLFTVLEVMRLRRPMTYAEVREFLRRHRRGVHMVESAPFTFAEDAEPVRPYDRND
jgi:lipopolysaccharide/colanic/teichoic acid biosynthesis glycosyltransferase